MPIFTPRVCAPVALSVLLASAVSFAQTPPSATGNGAAPATGTTPAQDEGRRQFELGVEALTDERYADALRAFRASYAVRPAPSVALNLGITLRALGRLVEARQYLDEFRRGASPAQHAEHDRVVTEYIADLDHRIASLRVTEASPSDLELTIDGEVSRGAVLGRTIPLDPGEHQLVAAARGFISTRQTLSASAGEQLTLRLLLRPVEPSVPARATPTPRSSEYATILPVEPRPRPRPSDSIATRWWFWTGVGVLVAAAIVIPVVVVTQSGYNDPAATNTGVVIQGARW